MTVNRTGLHRLLAGLFCLLLVCTLLPQTAFAAPLIEPEQPVSLTLSYRSGGVEFSLYRVANVSSTVVFTLASPFDAYAVSLEELDSDGWRAAATTLAAYVARDEIPALDSGTTDASGELLFPKQQGELATGVYLVIGQPSEEGLYTYTPEPFLICLPNRNTLDQWDYDATAQAKYDSVYNPPETITRKVLKVWDDKGNQSQRPKELSVDLLRDGVVYDRVKLTKANNWRYTWEELDSSYLWQVVETNVPKGYTVSTVREGTTFVITNSSKTAATPGSPEGSGNIAQTGMLWWPVPLLAVVGILILLLGLGRRWKQNGSNNG